MLLEKTMMKNCDLLLHVGALGFKPVEWVWL